jgi:hypothetical protein
MTAQTVLSPVSAVKRESKAEASSLAIRKSVEQAKPRAYWGDRWTICFWLFCFALMAAINLVEAVYRFVVSLFGS